MNNKYTPGPWRAEGWKGVVVNGSDGVTLALCPGDATKNGLEQVQANAKLIAAAPELVEALELCRTWFDCYGPHEANKKTDKAREAVQAARAALAKAGL